MEIEIDFKYDPVPYKPYDKKNAYWLLQVATPANDMMRDMLMGTSVGWITCHYRAIKACVVEVTANNKIRKWYRVWDDSRIYSEEDIYLTKELAIAECKHRNKGK